MTVNKVSVAWRTMDQFRMRPTIAHHPRDAGASCTITGEYKPVLGSGAQTANVYVTDSGGGSPQIATLLAQRRNSLRHDSASFKPQVIELSGTTALSSSEMLPPGILLRHFPSH